MAKINRFDGNLKAFGADAPGQERVIFGNQDSPPVQSDDLTANMGANFFRGWGTLALGNKPPREWFNGFAFTATQLAAYLHQMGVAEWDDEQEYYIDSLCTFNGGLFQSKVDSNIGNSPYNSPSQWRLVSTSLTTTTEIISSSLNPGVGTVISTKGFATENDGGAASWRATGNTIAAGQLPANTGDATLSDADGNEFKRVPAIGELESEISVAQVGALGGADDGLEIAAAIKFIDDLGGGVVQFSKDLYNTSVRWEANTGVLLKAVIRVDLGTNTNGSNSTDVKTMIRWIGASDIGSIYTILPANTGEAVWGGGSEFIEYDCNNLIASAVSLDNTKYALFDGKVRQATFAGVRISSASGAPGIFSSDNYVRSYEYIWGTQPATANSIGLLIAGNGSTVPSTQQKVGRISGLVNNGFMVEVSESDNCQFESVFASTQAGGTGGAMHFRNIGFGPANSHVVTYAVGKIKSDAGLYGNTFLHYISEAGTFEGDGAWDAELSDYVTGKRFKSHVHALRDKFSIPGASFTSDNLSVGNFGLQWALPELVDGLVRRLACVIPNKYNYDNGVIEGIEVIVGTNGTSGGNYDLTARLSNDVTPSGVVTPQREVNQIVAAGAQYTPTTYTFDMTDLQFEAGEHIFFSIERDGGAAGDTNTDSVFLLGVRVLFRGLGPDSPGSGTYNIPEW